VGVNRVPDDWDDASPAPGRGAGAAAGALAAEAPGRGRPGGLAAVAGITRILACSCAKSRCWPAAETVRLPAESAWMLPGGDGGAGAACSCFLLLWAERRGEKKNEESVRGAACCSRVWSPRAPEGGVAAAVCWAVGGAC
jgi:hypothetical protein